MRLFDRQISKKYSQSDVDAFFKRLARSKEFEVFEAYLANEKDALIRQLSRLKTSTEPGVMSNLAGRLQVVDGLEKKLLDSKD